MAIRASPDTVWRALVDAERRKDWWGYLELDPVAGGRFTERWTGPEGEPVVTSGTVLELVPDRRLRLRWSDQDWPVTTEVDITLTPRDEGTLVRIRHSGWNLLPDGHALADEHRAGWRVQGGLHPPGPVRMSVLLDRRYLNEANPTIFWWDLPH